MDDKPANMYLVLLSVGSTGKYLKLSPGRRILTGEMGEEGEKGKGGRGEGGRREGEKGGGLGY